MNKGELIDAVATELKGSKADASRAVDAVIECLTRGIRTDDGVTIAGFGTFTKKQRSARNGRNPATGAPIVIKPSKTVGFKPSQTLKEIL